MSAGRPQTVAAGAGQQSRAQALYAALGFEVEGVLWEEFRLENGSFTDDIVMARRLS